MKKSLFLVFLVILCGCTSHRPFTATSCEPLTEERKGDFSITSGIRPFGFYHLNINYAFSNHIALRIGNGGWINLSTFDASLFLFKNFGRYKLYAAPIFTYQRNTMDRLLYGGGSLFGYLKYKYNCEFKSPGFCIGASFKNSEKLSMHVIAKASYNISEKYYYYFYKYDGSASSYGGSVYHDETFNYPLPDFWSYEVMYSLIAKLNSFTSVKFTAGFIGCQRTIRHKYLYSTNSKSNSANYIKLAFQDHPVTFPVNLGVGVIFEIKPKKNKAHPL